MKKILLLSMIFFASRPLAAQSLDAIKEKVAELQSAGYSNEIIFASKEIAALLGAIKSFAEIKEAQKYLKQFASTGVEDLTENIQENSV